LDNTPGKESGELADPDGDGLLNLLEWTLGGNPLAESRSILPKVSRDATDLNMSFTREDTSEASTTLIAQWSTDMNTWNDVLVGGTSSSPTAAGIKITVTENASAPDTIMFSVPFSNATNGTLFLRLKTTRP
jgi:hypothetical protein